MRTGKKYQEILHKLENGSDKMKRLGNRKGETDMKGRGLIETQDLVRIKIRKEK